MTLISEGWDEETEGDKTVVVLVTLTQSPPGAAPMVHHRTPPVFIINTRKFRNRAFHCSQRRSFSTLWFYDDNSSRLWQNLKLYKLGIEVAERKF